MEESELNQKSLHHCTLRGEMAYQVFLEVVGEDMRTERQALRLVDDLLISAWTQNISVT